MSARSINNQRALLFTNGAVTCVRRAPAVFNSSLFSIAIAQRFLALISITGPFIPAREKGRLFNGCLRAISMMNPRNLLQRN